MMPPYQNLRQIQSDYQRIECAWRWNSILFWEQVVTNWTDSSAIVGNRPLADRGNQKLVDKFILGLDRVNVKYHMAATISEEDMLRPFQSLRNKVILNLSSCNSSLDDFKTAFGSQNIIGIFPIITEKAWDSYDSKTVILQSEQIVRRLKNPIKLLLRFLEHDSMIFPTTVRDIFELAASVLLSLA